MCAGWMRSLPAKSAIVRASLAAMTLAPALHASASAGDTPARSGSSPGLSRCMAAPSTFGVAAGLVHRAVVAHLGRSHTCTCAAAQPQVQVCRRWSSGRRPGRPWRWRTGLTAAPVRLPHVPGRGRRFAAALVVDAIDESFWNGTRGTSTWMSTPALACGASVRSSSGPESRFW